MKKIQLTQGKTALVDDCDYAYLNQWGWYVHKGRGTFYAETKIRTEESRKPVRMHRLIMNRLTDESFDTVDHINGDGLDNRRSNLRSATRSQNMANRGLNRNSTTGFKGVSLSGKKFRANIMAGGGVTILGTFPTAIEAAFHYDDACRELHGEFARPNFTEAEQFTYWMKQPQPVIDSRSIFTHRFQWTGVFKRGSRFFANIKVRGKTFHLGTFDTPEEAARAFDAAALKYSGPVLNYPCDAHQSEPQLTCFGLEPLLLTSRDAAKALAISERSLWTLTKSQQIPCLRLGRTVRYSVSQLQEWIGNNGQHQPR